MGVQVLLRGALFFAVSLLAACSSGGENDSGGAVDETVPEITLLGENPLDLSVGGTYTESGATASDNVDGDITSNIVIAGTTVDTAAVGTYVVTYNVNDAAGNAAVQVTRTVNVADTHPPEITLLGANPLNLSVGDTYIDPGATATDNVDGDITVNIVIAGDTVDTTIAGTYVVTYGVSDAAGNVATQLARTVNVSIAAADTVPPVITLLGENPLDISAGHTYIDPGATAVDNVDGDVSSNIVVSGATVDTSVVGSYAVTYDAIDAAGNSAVQVTRTVNVIDTTPPEITLDGTNTLEISVGDTYVDPGATATDNVDGDITGSIVIAGDTVNTTTVGTYVMTYNVSDAAGNTALEVTRAVDVVNDSPAIDALSISPDPAYINAAATFSWDVSDAN
ncbi:MAG: DUF5011 domain-containing protein, partial [Gammaproteobacteria bacterium]|nr:DUF5011 domain-containing protein [Gammaproteobacteria bacterium]